MKQFFTATCAAATILCVLVGPFIVSKLSDIRTKSAVIRQDAISSYGGDEVMALSHYVDDTNRSARNRNHAIGMLANLSDSRALPFLEKYYTGYDPSAKGYCCNSFSLCQYELSKAIARSHENKGMNLLTMVLR